MDVVPGGHYCHRCRHRVEDLTHASEVDTAALASGGRLCGEVDMRRAGPWAAALVAATLSMACAPWDEESMDEPGESCELVRWEDAPGTTTINVVPNVEEDAAVLGVVRHLETGDGLADAVVVLAGPELQGAREVITNARGIYRFVGLPPGEYVLTVLTGHVSVSKVFQLRQGDRFRADFRVDPDKRMLRGAVVAS